MYARKVGYSILLLLIAAVEAGGLPSVSGRELAMIVQVRTVHRAQEAYQRNNGSYASTLKSLGMKTPEHYWLNLRPTESGYAVLAIPKRWNEDGYRTFYSDETGVIRNEWSDSKLASAASNPIP